MDIRQEDRMDRTIPIWRVGGPDSAHQRVRPRVLDKGTLAAIENVRTFLIGARGHLVLRCPKPDTLYSRT